MTIKVHKQNAQVFIFDISFLLDPWPWIKSESNYKRYKRVHFQLLSSTSVLRSITLKGECGDDNRLLEPVVK